MVPCSLNDLQWPFQGHDYSTSNDLKMVQHTILNNGPPIESRISIERRHFQWPWTTSTPSFKVTPFFDAECLRNGTTYRHSFNEILIGTYTRPTQQCHFEWPWMVLSDLAKYSVTRSVVRSLCDSWASCWQSYDFNECCLLWKGHWRSQKYTPWCFIITLANVDRFSMYRPTSQRFPPHLLSFKLKLSTLTFSYPKSCGVWHFQNVDSILWHVWHDICIQHWYDKTVNVGNYYYPSYYPSRFPREGTEIL